MLSDTEEFFAYLASDGFVSLGTTAEECKYSKEISKFNNHDNEICIDNNASGVTSDDFLRSLHIEIANTCNERCVHCYIPHRYKTSIMDSSLFYKILEEGRIMNIIHVTISGGEPLMHPDIIDFIKRCNELDLSVNILSNLTFLTENMITEMKKNHFLSIQTSLYSMNPSIHDKITNLPGSFEKTRESIVKLCTAGIPIQISCPIMKQNKDTFQDVIKWAKSYNISVATEPEIFATYDHTCANLCNRLTIDEFGPVLDKQLTLDYAESLQNSAKKLESFSGNDPICSVCRYSFCVTADGDAFPCAGWQSNIIGDLKTQTVEDIWLTSPQIKALRNVKRKDFVKCLDCNDRGYCTVCMMANSNEDPKGDPFKIRDLHCQVAHMMHTKVKDILNVNNI